MKQCWTCELPHLFPTNDYSIGVIKRKTIYKLEVAGGGWGGMRIWFEAKDLGMENRRPSFLGANCIVFQVFKLDFQSS